MSLNEMEWSAHTPDQGSMSRPAISTNREEEPATTVKSRM